MSVFNTEYAATILVEAAYSNDDKATAKKYNISDRTIRRWRERMLIDPDLSSLVQLKKEKFEEGWADDLSIAIKAGITFIKDAALALPKNPESLHAVTGAVKILTEVAITKDILDVRFAGKSGGTGETA